MLRWRKIIMAEECDEGTISTQDFQRYQEEIVEFVQFIKSNSSNYMRAKKLLKG